MEYWFMALLLFGFALTFANLLYGIHINKKTYEQRVGWIHMIVPWESKRILLEGLESVSYQRHYNALFWQRDPLKMFPDEFRNLIENQTRRG
jgi:hypothetical protein